MPDLPDAPDLSAFFSSDPAARSGEVTTRPVSGSVQRHQAAPGESTRSVSFSGRLVTWEEMPLESSYHASSTAPLVAEGVTRDSDQAVRVDGVLHQRMRGWRAFEDRVVVATALRTLVVGIDGRMRPVGDWFHHRHAVLLPGSPPERRDGEVPADGAAGEAGGDRPGAPGSFRPRPLVAAQHEAGARAARYLPAVVAQGLVEAVPAPERWFGSLVQFSRRGYPSSQTLTQLRTQPGRAVAVAATRALSRRRGYDSVADAEAALSRTPWQITQVTYELPVADGRTLAPGTRPGEAR